ncbi:cadherin domain-containing protein [Flavivirga spongiicola]|uniref:Cadherin domain-containing protein n=1 Tax=Flavivirga spongiicola TaxID=421621 RepID=A0ABU7XVU0_9FLAO|nr:cadherin domain-containing protein [Flavivirga sp. MEBiC05379]MDO5979900.1 cadherin domain-containing protein [Flavivirga sp. MEBiC05379]
MKTIKRSLIVLMAILSFSCGKDDEPANVAPTIEAQSFNASEAATDTDVFGTVKATDLNGDKLSYKITKNSNNLFEITNTGNLSLIANSMLDYETATTHTITIEVSDGQEKATAVVTINVVNDNEVPVIAAQSFSVVENSIASVVIGKVVTTDPDGDNLTYTLTGGTGITTAGFEITGDEIKLKSGRLNYEETKSHTVTITVSDGTLTATANITINVTDVNEAPNIGPSVYTVAENIDDTFKIGGISTSDEDGDTLTFSLEDSSASSKFEIDSATGFLSLRTGSSLDYEAKTFHNFNVKVSDGDITTTAQVTVYVTDVNEDEYTVSPWMGNGNTGLVNAVGQSARFYHPKGVAILGNNLYIADADNNVIRHVDITTGAATIFAGTGVAGYNDGTKQNAQFRSPSSVAVDRFGIVYVADNGNHSIRKITATAVTTIGGNGMNPGLIDGPAHNSRFRFPSGIAVDSDGFNVYVADNGNHAIRRISIAGNGNITVTTIAGNGTSGDVDGQHGISRLNSPTNIALHKTQNLLYITDTGNNKIKTMSHGGQTITTLVSAGTGFVQPYGIVLDQNNDTFYTTNFGNHSVYKSIKNGNGNFTTTVIAGSSAGFVNGPGSSALFRQPWGIGLNAQGVIFVSEYGNNAIRKISETHQP